MKSMIASFIMAGPNGPLPSRPSGHRTHQGQIRQRIGRRPEDPRLRESRPSCHRPPAGGWRFFTMGAAWLGATAGLVAAGALSWLPMPFPQVYLAVMTMTLLLLFGRVNSFRAWVLGLDLRLLLLPHAVRLVGAWFIVLHFRSQLPYAFAIPSGIGDLAAAAAALGVAFVPAHRPAGRWVWLAWNAFGLADILFVIANAARIGLADPASMAAFTTFPLGLLPAFFVPLILVSHLVLFLRLTGRARSEC